MGNLCSCFKSEEKLIQDGQYASLVITKPIDADPDTNSDQGDKFDVPVFQAAASDDENAAVSDPETLTDTELNLYAQKLGSSDEGKKK